MNTKVEQNDASANIEERLARALLTLAAVESAVQKIERYLETNGQYLPLDAKVPMRAQSAAMRNALDSWKAER